MQRLLSPLQQYLMLAATRTLETHTGLYTPDHSRHPEFRMFLSSIDAALFSSPTDFVTSIRVKIINPISQTVASALDCPVLAHLPRSPAKAELFCVALFKVIKLHPDRGDMGKTNKLILIFFQVMKNVSCKCIVESENRLHNGCIVRDCTEILSESWQ